MTGGSVGLNLNQTKLTIEWTVGQTKYKIEADLKGRSASGESLKMGSRFSVFRGEREETGWQKERSTLLIVDTDGDGIEIALFDEDAVEFRQLRAGEDPAG